MYRPARGGRSCEHFGGCKTINRIPLPFILDAIYWVAHALEEVEATIIQRCSARCGFSLETSPQNQVPDSSEIDENDISLAVLRISKELFGHEFTELAKTYSHIQTSVTTAI